MKYHDFSVNPNNSGDSQYIMYERIIHDLKTPLSVMYMHLQTLERACGNDDKMLYCVKSAKNNWYQIIKMINDASDSQKIMEGAVLPTLRNCDIVEIIHRIAEPAGMLSGRKGVSFALTCGVRSKIMATDGEIVERIMLNLLSNACRRAVSGGKVSLEGIDCGNTFIIKIRSSGEDEAAYRLGAEEMNKKEPLWYFVVKLLAGLIGGSVSIKAADGGLEAAVTLPVMLMHDESAVKREDNFYSDNIFQIELLEDL